MILTADHGNDPTYSGTDHTREYVPFLAWSPAMKEGGRLNDENTFAVIGASVAENFRRGNAGRNDRDFHTVRITGEDYAC